MLHTMRYDLLTKEYISWFEILADSDIYRQYRITFWGTWYDVNLIISADILVNIDDMANVSYIDGRNWRYRHKIIGGYLDFKLWYIWLKSLMSNEYRAETTQVTSVYIIIPVLVFKLLRSSCEGKTSIYYQVTYLQHIA